MGRRGRRATDRRFGMEILGDGRKKKSKQGKVNKLMNTYLRYIMRHSSHNILKAFANNSTVPFSRYVLMEYGTDIRKKLFCEDSYGPHSCIMQKYCCY